MLRATELGVSATWCNFFPNRALERAFDLPGQERVVLIMPIGYPAAGVGPSPLHARSKPLEALVRRR